MFSQHSSSASNFIEEASRQFGELGVIKSRLDELIKQTSVAKDRIDYLFQDQVELRTEAKKCKQDYKYLKKEFETTKQKVRGLEKNKGIYFDAYRSKSEITQHGLPYFILMQRLSE